MKSPARIITSVIICFLSFSAICQTQADTLLNFIKQNPTRSSIYLQKNDTTVAALNENKLMPLASTVKILVALEFAKQAANNVVDENAMILLSELNRYYIPNTDGGAHPAWIKYEKSKGHITNDSISLLNVARGMILFSSNANTEYLMDLLGLDNVKNNIQLLGIKQHTAIYPLVASLFIYQNPRHLKEEKLIKSINRLDDETYSRFIYDIHKALKYSDTLKTKFRPQDLTEKMQHTWSNRLPASTTKDYVRICKIINNRKFFSTETYKILSKVLESIMENPVNKINFKYAGMKGGSTSWILTKALYATTVKDDKIEMAYFFNELNPQENAMLQRCMNSFELAVLTDEGFRKKMGNTIMPPHPPRGD